MLMGRRPEIVLFRESLEFFIPTPSLMQLSNMPPLLSIRLS